MNYLYIMGNCCSEDSVKSKKTYSNRRHKYKKRNKRNKRNYNNMSDDSIPNYNDSENDGNNAQNKKLSYFELDMLKLTDINEYYKKINYDINYMHY